MHDYKIPENLEPSERLTILNEALDIVVDCYSLFHGKKKLNAFEKMALDRSEKLLTIIGLLT